MATRGEQRREKILAVAESIILQQGFAATSIEDILQQAHITKGGFFYHFHGKPELAKALVERYIEADEAFFGGLIERARFLSDDPLQQVLLFINLLAEAMENLEDLHPGCLVASFTYESRLLDEDVKRLISTGMLRWRQIFRDLLDPVCARYKPRLDVSMDEVADMLTAQIEGGIIVSRVQRDKQQLPQLLRQYRNYIKLLFAP